MDKLRVTKEFVFDMAHALYNYDGPCKNIHGHTYKLQVTIWGEIKDVNNGMVMDFTLLKSLVKQTVIDEFDHALVLNDNLPIELKNKALAISDKVIFTPFQPTCENLLLHFKNLIKPTLHSLDVALYAVKLYETPTSWAEWSTDDQK